MTPKAFMLMAAGNLPAALYEDRKARRLARYAHKVEDEQIEIGYTANPNLDMTGLEPLKTFIPTGSKAHKLAAWMVNALDTQDMEALTTCKVGICTAGGLVAWSSRTKVEIRKGEIAFTGTFAGLPNGSRFSKIVLTMKNGDEIGRKALDYSLSITEGVVAVSATYTIRFRL